MATNTIVFFVNGKKHEVKNINPTTKILHYLRDNLHITSAKEGCSRGVCGACTVMVSEFDSVSGQTNHSVVNACYTPLLDVHNKHVVTVEGLGTVKNGLHPVQERFSAAHASQCGFCTPGFVIAFYTLVRNQPNLTTQQIVDNIDGNLCRCTGYRPILDAMKSFTKEGCCGENKCSDCPSKQEGEGHVSCCTGLSGKNFKPLDFDSELIFPPSLKQAPSPLHVTDGTTHWYAPTKIEELSKILKENPGCKFIGGNGQFQLTEGGVYVSVKNIPEFRQISTDDSGVHFGGSVTLQKLKTFLDTQKDNFGYHAVAEQLGKIANTQVRSNATAAGNIATHEWHSDFVPALTSLNAKVTILGVDGNKKESKVEELNLTPSDVILSVTIPKTSAYVRSYKTSKKDSTSRSFVSATFSLSLTDGKVADISLVYGAVSTKTKRAKNTEALLKGKEWSTQTLSDGLQSLEKELQDDISKLPESDYRRSLALSYFFMFYHSSSAHFNKTEDQFKDSIHTPLPSVQKFNFPTEEKLSVHKPAPHASGDLHTTGEAKFTGDIHIPDCLHSYLILSTNAHAKITKIDDSKAKAMPGVVAIYYDKDVPQNSGNGFFGPESVFAQGEVNFYGEPVGIVVADTFDHAKAAAKSVEITYKDLPVINNIDDAIKAGSFAPVGPFPSLKELSKGDIESGFAESDVIIDGEFNLAGCVHYYLEPHVSVAIPGERNEMTLYTTTQSVDGLLAAVSRSLKLPSNNFNIVTKRLGGGFGGKGNIVQACSAAVAANKLNRPVKLFVEREVDMLIVSKRPAYKLKYKLGSKSNGKLVSLELEIYNNGGFNGGFGSFLMGETLESIDSCYNVPNVRANSQVCLTNRVPCQAMRGAGTPQAIAFMETMLEHLSGVLKIPSKKLRELNFYQEGDQTPFHQKLTNFPELGINWERILASSDYENRSLKIADFNKQNRFKKRGICIAPTRYGIGTPTIRGLLKGTAYVSLLADGTALVVHGGIEMGQGLHTKILQIAASALELPIEKVLTPAPSSNLTPNTFATGGSYGTDVHGAAVLNACKTLNERLAPVKAAMPGKSLVEILQAANFMGVNLSAQGFHIWDPWSKDHDFLYYTWNCSVSEAEVDLLTGKATIERVDLIQDVGQSLNPAVDIGQVEGGYVQALSWLTTEDLETLHHSNGVVDLNPESYEILGLKNVPKTINVELTPGIKNPHAPYSSKGIGEPPYSLGITGALAVRKAISAAREEHGLEPWIQLDYPITRPRIQNALHDVVSKLLSEEKKSK